MDTNLYRMSRAWIAGLAMMVTIVGNVSCAKRVADANEASNPVAISQLQGGQDAGGGEGIACQTAGVTTVTPLDLYEARQIYGLDLDVVPATDDEAKALFIKTISVYLRDPMYSVAEQDAFIAQEYERLQSTIRFVDADQVISPTNDATAYVLPKSCARVQIASYVQESALLINKDHWAQMDRLGRISLLTHEFFYQRDRISNGATKSDLTRRLVAHLYSKQGLLPIYAEVVKSPRVFFCQTSGDMNSYTSFYLIPASKKLYDNLPAVAGRQAVFSRINGRSPLLKTTAFFMNMSEDNEKILSSPAIKVPYSLSYSSVTELETATYPLSSSSVGIQMSADKSLPKMRIFGTGKSAQWSAPNLQCRTLN